MKLTSTSPHLSHHQHRTDMAAQTNPRNKLAETIRNRWVRDDPHYDKPRLLLAYYEQPQDPANPRVALMIAPKFERDKSGQLKLPIPATKYYVHNTLVTHQGDVAQPWRFARVDTSNLDDEPNLLICVVIGKVLDPERAPDVLSAIPVYQDHMYMFGSRIWVEQAIEIMLAAGITTGLYARTALGGADSYLKEKRAEGRWSQQCGGRRVWPAPTVPILDMTTGKQERT